VTISHPRALVLGLSLIIAACGGEGLTLPPEGEAAHIEVLDEGNGQSGRVDETLALPLVVRVTDSRNRPVANANVVFTFTNGVPAVADPSSASTGVDGLASVALKLGSQAGPVTGMAEVPVAANITPVQANFTALALPANANGIAKVAGDSQSGTINTALPNPLVVQVTDSRGNPIPGVTVVWTAETGGGSVSEANTTTGADGRTSVIRILGSAAGQQTTSATATGLSGSPVIFTHTATAGSASRVEKISGDNQSANPGEQLAQPLVVQVLDGSNNPIPGRAVTWVIGNGDGTVNPTTSTTDAQGNASTNWTLGPGIGSNTVNAVVSGVGTVTFTATATAGSASASNSTVSASPTTITVGSGSSTITVTVRDASNNPVGGVSVSLESSGSGNTFNAASAPTASNGVATFTFSSTVAETKTITATAGGVVITDQATITVQKASSTIEITSDDPEPSTVGEPVTVEFTVSGPGATPTGNVSVTISGGSENCQATLANGSGSCSLTPLTPGTGTNNRRILTATYDGDAHFSGDTDTDNHRVNPAPPPPPASTTTTITSDTPDPSDAGAAITVSFTVTSPAGTPTGDVQVTDPLGGSCSGSVAAGSCSYTPGGMGPRNITATYAGNSAFNGSSDTEEHTVTAPPPSNTAPTANPDTYVTQAGVQRTVGQDEKLLNNDVDPDAGDILSVEYESEPTHGVIQFRSSDGTFDYTPNQDGSTTDSFTYHVRDLAGAVSNSTTVTFIINP